MTRPERLRRRLGTSSRLFDVCDYVTESIDRESCPRPRRPSILKMEASGSQIPVVDFSAIGLENADPLNENRQAVKIVADQLYRAFSTIGFAYLRNHGIPEQMVQVFFRFFCPDEDGCHENSDPENSRGLSFRGLRGLRSEFS